MSRSKQVLVSSTQKGISIGMILLLIVAGIFLEIGAYLVGQFQLNLSTSGLPANAVAAQVAIYTDIYSAFQLAGIGLLVIAAVGILQILTSGFGGAGGKGRA